MNEFLNYGVGGSDPYGKGSALGGTGIKDTKNWAFDAFNQGGRWLVNPAIMGGYYGAMASPYYYNALQNALYSNTPSGAAANLQAYQKALEEQGANDAARASRLAGFRGNQNLQGALGLAAQNNARRMAGNAAYNVFSPDGQQRMAGNIGKIVSGFVDNPYTQGIRNSQSIGYKNRGGLTLGSAIGAGLSLAGQMGWNPLGSGIPSFGGGSMGGGHQAGSPFPYGGHEE